MHPRRDPDVSRLVTDPVEFLHTLRDFVRNRGLVGYGKNWREVERSFADEHAFLDFSARRDGGQARVLIEFGVEHQGERHRVGFFDAYWDAIDADFRQLVAVSLNGEPADLDGFAVRLLTYLTLPLTNTEAALAA